MGKAKLYYRFEVPYSVVLMVRAVCADYYRRAKLARRTDIGEAVLKTCSDLNVIVDLALEQIEPGIREDILYDIAQGRGYSRSCAQLVISKNAYYRRRRKLIHDIAKSLLLL